MYSVVLFAKWLADGLVNCVLQNPLKAERKRGGVEVGGVLMLRSRRQPPYQSLSLDLRHHCPLASLRWASVQLELVAIHLQWRPWV